MENANSTEFDKDTAFPIIDKLNLVTKEEINEIGYTISRKLRIGGRKIVLKKDSLMSKIYQKDEIIERFRHRYSFNLKYLDKFANNGIDF